jgi:hypothetical protein
MSTILSERLSDSRKAIRAYIQNHWDDQRLHDVYAFNADGKMRFASSCCCLMGVTKTEALHEKSCNDHFEKQLDSHYYLAQRLPGGVAAEEAYRTFGYYFTKVGKTLVVHTSDELRRVRLSALLRAEIRRRARKEAAAETDRPRVTAEV